MGLFSKGQTTANKISQQNNSPPSWTEDLLKQGAKDAQELYLAQKNKKPLIELSDTSKDAIKGLEGVANNYNKHSMDQAFNDKSYSENNLSKIASGETINHNPFFEKSLTNQLNQAANVINSQMSGAGRYGSGANTAILAQTLGSIAQDAQAKQYNQDIDHMFQANNLMDHNRNEKLNTENDYYKGQSEAFLNMLTGGSVLDKNAQMKQNAEYENGWDQLNKLLDAGRKASGNYGSSSQVISNDINTVQNSGMDGLFSIAGKVLPFLAKSDYRAKRNIRFYGYEKGFPLYTFRYRTDPRYYLGLIAQDIVKLRPDAVKLDPMDGLLAVDYQKLGLRMRRICPIRRHIFGLFKRLYYKFIGRKSNNEFYL